MTMLCDSEIESGWFVKIDHLKDSNLTPNGYDLTIAEVLVDGAKKSVKKGTAKVPPKTHFLVSTVEVVHLGPTVAGGLWIKTSWARKGVVPSFGMIDAGFEGSLTLSAFNSSSEELEMGIGKTFAQMVFHKMARWPDALYGERSGTYQNQLGVTLSRDRKV